MGKVKRKRPYPKRERQRPQGQNEGLPTHALPMSKVVDLAIDIWKIHLRSKAEQAPDRVVAACERAEDRLARMGFELSTLVGKPYDTNVCARVVEHLPAGGPLMVAECLAPAVYFEGQLVREAEIVTSGSL